jgi:hypothetical protein
MTMEDLIQCIRASLAEGATPEQKQAGASACCAIYSVLSPPPGVPITVPYAARPALNVDHALDLAIAKLRTMLPADTEVQTTSLRFPFLGGGKAP